MLKFMLDTNICIFTIKTDLHSYEKPSSGIMANCASAR